MEMDEAGREVDQARMSPEAVLGLIQGALQYGLDSRAWNEQELSKCEEEGRPGYLSSLLMIVAKAQELPADVRLYAAVLAKNVVGSSQRKVLHTREWTRVPEDERQLVKDMSLQLLVSEESDQIAMQIILLIANITGFDFPSKWPDLLTYLLEPTTSASPYPLLDRRHVRTLRACKHVARAIKEKRVVALNGGGLFMPRRDRVLKLLQDANAEKAIINSQTWAAVGQLLVLWQETYRSFQSSEYRDVLAGSLALYALSAAIEMFMAYTNTKSNTQNTLDMTPLCQAAHDLSHLLPAVLGQDDDRSIPLGICSRMFERLTQFFITILERGSSFLMTQLTDLLQLYMDRGLLSVTAAEIQQMRPKRTYLMLRILCIFMVVTDSYMLIGENGPQVEEAKDRARSALNEIYNGSQTAHVLAALVSKYLAITDRELQLWQTDPEEYAQANDVEFKLDSHDPRTCALTLLLHLLLQAPGSILEALKELLRGVRQAQASSESVLLQEACYLAIGESLKKLSTSVVDTTMGEWWPTELKPILEMPPREEESLVEYRALRCRAIWVMSMETAQDWVVKEAVGLIVANLAHPDLVVALQAVSTLATLFQRIITDLQDMVDNEGMLGSMIHFISSRLIMPDLRGEAERYETLVDHIAQVAPTVVQHLWQLQGRLNEIESQIQSLQLVSLLLELTGSRSEAIVNSVVSSLPQVWKQVNADYGSSNKGAAVRLKSTMLELFIDLVVCLEDKIGQYPQVAEASPQLLEQSIYGGWDENPELRESGLDLLGALLVLDPGGYEKFQRFIPQLVEILRSGKNNSAVLKLLSSFIVLAGSQAQNFLGQILPDILLATSKCISRVYSETLESAVAGTRNLSGHPHILGLPHGAIVHRFGDLAPGGGIDEETMTELGISCGLLEILLLLKIDQGALEDQLRVLAAIACDKGMQQLRGVVPNMGVTDKPLELLQRALFDKPRPLSALDCDSECETVFLDRTLLSARRRYIAEIGTSIESIRKAARQTRHLVAACLCKLGLAGTLPQMFNPEFIAQVMLIVLQAFDDAQEYKKDLQDLELEMLSEEGSKDRCKSEILRLQLQDPWCTCDMREVGPEFVKQVLNDHKCISQLTPALLGLLTRMIADNEKNNVSKSEIQDLMAQLDHTGLG